ncbi:MAG: hypothetical protein WC549_00480 [Actinomycetota bacterium]
MATIPQPKMLQAAHLGFGSSCLPLLPKQAEGWDLLLPIIVTGGTRQSWPNICMMPTGRLNGSATSYRSF